MEAKEQENDAKKKLDEAAKTLNDIREPIEYGDFVWHISFYFLFFYSENFSFDYNKNIKMLLEHLIIVSWRWKLFPQSFWLLLIGRMKILIKKKKKKSQMKMLQWRSEFETVLQYLISLLSFWGQRKGGFPFRKICFLVCSLSKEILTIDNLAWNATCWFLCAISWILSTFCFSLGFSC